MEHAFRLLWPRTITDIELGSRVCARRLQGCLLPPPCVVFAKAYSPIPGQASLASDGGAAPLSGVLSGDHENWGLHDKRWEPDKSGTRGLQHPGHADVSRSRVSCQPP